MTFSIASLDGEGRGIVQTDEGVFRLPFSAPGDIIRIEDGEAVLADPCSPQRATPRCLHFGLCGGCALQHIGDAAVAAWKRGRVTGALRAVGIDAAAAETVTVPPCDRRRVKLSFQRTKKAALLGFMQTGSHRVVPLTECHVAQPQIVAALPMLAALLSPGAPRKRALGVTVTVSEAGLDVSVMDGKELDLSLRETLATATGEADLARLTWNGETIATRHPPFQRFGRAKVVPPPGAFLQASPTAEAILLDLVREAVGDAKTVADLFAGCGAFSLPLAESASVTAVEGDAAMTEALDRGWRNAEGLRPVTAIARDLFRRPLRIEELAGFDAVVFDPPRAGARAQAEQLAQSRVPVIAGVSCNPASFARDARILIGGGYRLTGVTPVDQFRWSPHIELTGVFRRD